MNQSTLMEKTFDVNGVSLIVQMDFSAMEQTLKQIEQEWEPGAFTEVFSCEEGNVTADDYFGDITRMREGLQSIQNHPGLLEHFVKKVRKKKNGDFWMNSGTTIETMDFVSTYFTDFTNAWSVLQLRLEVESNRVCRLTLHKRTVTS
ncbi:hypothetical protein JK635_08240 [Neobacillus sp. YIM B02564]|uniref:Uncharacterized protein n=1 Tax=Neobacillus paridis TaxID=2803862 RepID=A0ABS1TLS1_9BACI|nr:hypothetical protein [Neobacillus paridis]MBL4952197.1 hypothetical protein [Neobacillus paridis]